MARGAFGQRKNVGWIAFAILALLVGAVLFRTVGSADKSGRTLSDSSTSNRTTSPLERQAERVEERLAKNPDDTKLLLATMQAWVEAGNDRLSKLRTAGRPLISSRVPDDLETGLRAWGRYLRQTGGEASADMAEFAGGTFFELVEIGSRRLSEVEANAAGAARAGRIAGRHRPDLFTLSNVAIYEEFNGEFAAGGETWRRAAAAGNTKAEAKIVWEQMAEYRERAKRFRAEVERAAKTLRASGEEELRAPIKGYGSPAGING